MAKENYSASLFGARLTSVISVTLTLLVLGLIAQCGLAVYNATRAVRANTVLYLRTVPGADNLEVNRIKRLIKTVPEVSSYTFTSADQVLAQEVATIGEETAALLDSNPYSAEFELHLTPQAANAATIERISKVLGKDAAVEEVSADVTVVENINRTFSKAALTLGAVALALLVISFVLINNTVSLSIYSRRFLIHTMKLVGATPGFIRRPFVRAGFVNGLISGMIAVAVLGAVQWGLIEHDPDLAPLLTWPETAAVFGALVVLSCLICTVAAAIAANTYLRRNYDGLYRK